VGARLQAAGTDINVLPDATLRSVFYCGAVWAETVRFAWEQGGPESSLGREGRAFTTFYENIVLSPDSQIRNICDFIGIPFASEMLYPERHQHDVVADNIWTMKEALESPISMLSAGRWIDHLSLADRIMFYARGHVGLRITGYDESPEWLFRGMSMSVEQASEALSKARADLTGIAQTSPATTPRESGISPARVTVEKIIASTNIADMASSNPVPEVEALLRTASQTGRTFIGG